MNKIENIEKFLSEKFDLSKNEIDLYIALLKSGHSTVLELSELTGINRATTHINIENLTKKRLITQIKRGQGARRSIIAEPPEKLLALLQEKKAQLEEAEQQLPDIISGLFNLKKNIPKKSGMEIRYYKDKNEIRFIYDEALKAKEFRAYLNCKKLMEIFPMNITKFSDTNKKRLHTNIWEVMEDSPEARAYAETMTTNKFHCRLVPKNINLAVIDYMIFDGKVALVDLRENVLNGIIINNESYYQNAKTIHEFVWQFLTPYKG